MTGPGTISWPSAKKWPIPAKGVYGAWFPVGFHESWHWINFLWSAGGEVIEYDETKDEWRAVFNSPASASE